MIFAIIIFIEEGDEEDLELLKSGALFYWTIGFQKDPYTMRVSLIRFRRIPPITKGQLLRAKVQAGRLGDLLNAG